MTARIIPINAPVDMDLEWITIIGGGVFVVFADAMLMICEGAASIHEFWATEKLECS